MSDTCEPTREVPCLAAGLEFGMEDTAGGNVIAFLPPDRFLEVSAQTARLLRLVDGRRDIPTLAQLASAELSTEVSPGAFQTLLEQSLVPRGLIRYGEPAPAGPRADAARRVQLIPAPIVALLARLLGFLFRPPVATIALAAGMGAQLWFFRADRPPEVGVVPSMIGGWLAAIVVYLLSMPVHELGHATAMHTFGVTPGVIGLSATRSIPHWIADVSGIWKLRRWQRVVVDLAGIYFQAIFIGALILLHAVLPLDVPWLVVARALVLVDVLVLLNLAPLWKSDGFWLAADLAGTRYRREDTPPPGARGARSAFDTAKIPGGYAPVYAIIASVCFAGLWIWLAGHAQFDTPVASMRTLDGASRIALALTLTLRTLVLGGLALSIWAGLAWIAGVARSPGRARPHMQPGGKR